MNIGGIIFISLSWIFLIVLNIFCFTRVLQKIRQGKVPSSHMEPVDHGKG